MNLENQEIEKIKYQELLSKLIQIAKKSLYERYLISHLEFSSKHNFNNQKFEFKKNNARITLISLIGLHKAESHNLTTKIDLKKVLQNQIKKAEKYTGIGELGLLLWAAALISPEDITRILTKVNFNNIFKSYKDARQKLTIELSWLLNGLLMASTFSEVFKNSIGNLTQKVYWELRNNYDGAGIFRHQGNHTIIGKLKGDISNFEDQIFPIHSFTLYSQQVNNEEALLIAKECALKICEQQDENGQWSSKYNSKTGIALNRNQVHSIHKYALATFALFSIQKASKVNFEKYIINGLDWLKINSELQIIKTEDENNSRWMAMASLRTKDKLISFLSALGFYPNKLNKSLGLENENLSNYFGWILYAFAGRINDLKINNSADKLGTNHFQIFNFN